MAKISHGIQPKKVAGDIYSAKRITYIKILKRDVVNFDLISK